MVALNPGTLESHSSWAEEFGFGFPIAVDAEAKVAAAYGALDPEGEIRRTVVLVNKQGVVAWAQAGMPSTEAILQAIEAMAKGT